MMLLSPTQSLDQSAGFRSSRKRKADNPPENNERLSKRLSLLNLEHGGPKLYVPVENPQRTDETSSTYYSSPPRNVPHKPRAAPSDTELMQIDDSKHKVYIYNLDDELSSGDESEDNKKVIFLPDIEKHLRSNRIPTHVLANPQELAEKQLVLYSVPSSISVPEEQDSVRKAILEARARLREKAEAEAARKTQSAGTTAPVTLDFAGGILTGVSPPSFPQQDYDPDAMEID